MEKHRIAVISDTHGLLRPKVIERVKICEAVLHAGDMDKPEILEQLKAIAPVYAVRGNVDEEWVKREQGDLPEELDFTLFGFRFYMIHNKKRRRKELSGISAVVYGHSHEYSDIWEAKTGIRYLNPGSCGPKRFGLPVTMMEMTLCPEENRMEIERGHIVGKGSVPAGEKGHEGDAGRKGHPRDGPALGRGREAGGGYLPDVRDPSGSGRGRNHGQAGKKGAVRNFVIFA